MIKSSHQANSPGHDFGVFRGVVSEPIVSFTEIVEDNFASVSRTSRQHDRRARISLGRHPRAMERIPGDRI